MAAVEEPDQTHLKVSIIDREKHGTKTDTYVMYKICTDVSLWEGGWEESWSIAITMATGHFPRY